jgi:hypothetical protein
MRRRPADEPAAALLPEGALALAADAMALRGPAPVSSYAPRACLAQDDLIARVARLYAGTASSTVCGSR